MLPAIFAILAVIYSSSAVASPAGAIVTSGPSALNGNRLAPNRLQKISPSLRHCRKSRPGRLDVNCVLAGGPGGSSFSSSGGNNDDAVPHYPGDLIRINSHLDATQKNNLWRIDKGSHPDSPRALDAAFIEEKAFLMHKLYNRLQNSGPIVSVNWGIYEWLLDSFVVRSTVKIDNEEVMIVEKLRDVPRYIMQEMGVFEALQQCGEYLAGFIEEDNFAALLAKTLILMKHYYPEHPKARQELMKRVAIKKSTQYEKLFELGKSFLSNKGVFGDPELFDEIMQSYVFAVSEWEKSHKSGKWVQKSLKAAKTSGIRLQPCYVGASASDLCWVVASADGKRLTFAVKSIDKKQHKIPNSLIKYQSRIWKA